MPPLKGTEMSLSYTQCFLYFESSSINVYFSHCMAGYLRDRPHISPCSRDFFLALYLSLTLSHHSGFLVQDTGKMISPSQPKQNETQQINVVALEDTMVSTAKLSAASAVPVVSLLLQQQLSGFSMVPASLSP